MVTGGAATPHGEAAPLYPDDIHDGSARSSSVWDFSRLLPIPRQSRPCPFCAGALAVKDWKLHRRDGLGSVNPWRCDVRLKCMTCGFVPTFGVRLDQPTYDRAVREFGRDQWIHWRAARVAFEEVRSADPSQQ